MRQDVGQGLPCRSCVIGRASYIVIFVSLVVPRGLSTWNEGNIRAVSFSIGLGNGDWLRLYSTGACPPFRGKVGGPSGTGTSAALRSQSPLIGPK